MNLLTGPLYFIYKIISVINLTKELKGLIQNRILFLFIGWPPKIMILKKSITFFSKETKWNGKKESKGPVGRIDTSGLEELFESF